MLKTYLYVPDQLNTELVLLAKTQKVSKAALMRDALEEGITHIKKKRAGSASLLLRIAEIGKKYRPNGPRDLSSRMDEYLWEAK